MDMRDKVIKGLQCCINGERKEPACEDCPYREVDTCTKLHELHQDMLDILKADKPRVLTMKEAEKSNVCCIEDRDDDVEYPVNMISGWGYMEIYEMANEMPFRRNMSEYNKTWRCWDKEPKKEQMEATPWMT